MEMTETMEDWKSASELLLLAYVHILWTWLPKNGAKFLTCFQA